MKWQIDVVREEHRLCYTVEMGNLCMYVCMYCMKGMTKSSSLIKVACTCVCSDKVMLSQNWAQFPPQKIAFFFVWQLEKANNVVFYRFSSGILTVYGFDLFFWPLDLPRFKHIVFFDLSIRGQKTMGLLLGRSRGQNRINNSKDNSFWRGQKYHKFQNFKKSERKEN